MLSKQARAMINAAIAAGTVLEVVTGDRHAGSTRRTWRGVPMTWAVDPSRDAEKLIFRTHAGAVLVLGSTHIRTVTAA